MEPLNKSERNTSMFNFVAVYLIVLSLPLCLAFWMGKKYPAKSGGQAAISEQKALADEMTALQVYLKKMEEIDIQRPQETASNETWNTWIQDAEKQNNDFRTRIDKFQKNVGYTGVRLTMRDNACSYLYRVNIERKNYLAKRGALLQERDETAELERLKIDNARLASDKQNMQNTVNTLMAQAAQARNNAGSGNSGGGGGGGSTKEVEDLKLQLQFNEANCKKTQADLLATYNERLKRRQLYTSARKNFEKVSRSARNNYTFQQLASEKIQEIDQSLMRL